jgi:segregation and condensation protein B
VSTEVKRAIEAVVMVADSPVELTLLAQMVGAPTEHVASLLSELAEEYRTEQRGFELVAVAGGWRYQSHPDQAPVVERFVLEGQTAKLSAAALETLAIIAYHQPVTRAEIEEIRGVSLGKGTLDLLIEIGWVRPRGRRKAPGRPVTYGTTETFLAHFGLDQVSDLPGLDELVGVGLLDRNALGGAGSELPLEAEPDAAELDLDAAEPDMGTDDGR